MAQVNGEAPSSPRQAQSVFLEHLLKYPVVKDGVATFKQNQLGQKSIQISDQAYKTFAQPVLPYLARPYAYVSPYLERADLLGDQTLTKVDERFPVVKKPTGELYTDATNLVFLPYHKALEGKDHALKTYSAEVKKIGGENVVTYGKALVSTVFALSNETLTFVGNYLNTKRADAKEHVNDKN